MNGFGNDFDILTAKQQSQLPQRFGVMGQGLKGFYFARRNPLAQRNGPRASVRANIVADGVIG